MSRGKQSLAAAVLSVDIVRALNALVGCPVGGWGETDQAFRRLVDAIPHRDGRSYTANELVEYALTVDHADRYQWRPAHLRGKA